MIVTLGVQYVVRGLVNVITKGVAISAASLAVSLFPPVEMIERPKGIIMIAAVFMDIYRRNSSQRSGS